MTPHGIAMAGAAGWPGPVVQRSPACGAHRRGFSLLEMVVVVVVMSVLAVTAAPSIELMFSARRGGAAAEVARTLERARTNAIATGNPSGVAVDLAGSTLTLVELTVGAVGPTVIDDPLGQPAAPVRVAELFNGVTIDRLTHGDGTSAGGTLWYGFTGTPETRDGDGGFVAEFTQDAVIELSSGAMVTIRRGSGLVERRAVAP